MFSSVGDYHMIFGVSLYALVVREEKRTSIVRRGVANIFAQK